MPAISLHTGQIVGTVISPVISPGPSIESVEVGGIRATYLRRFKMQVFAILFEDISHAIQWPSFEPLGGLKE